MTARRFASAGDGLPYYVSYGAAIILVAAALAVRSGLGYSFGRLPTYVTFYPALILAALLGGFGPGLLATALGAILADLFFITPIGSFRISRARRARRAHPLLLQRDTHQLHRGEDAQGADRGRGGPAERGALPRPGGQHGAARLDSGRPGKHLLVQQAVVRVHGHDPGRDGEAGMGANSFTLTMRPGLGCCEELPDEMHWLGGYPPFKGKGRTIPLVPRQRRPHTRRPGQGVAMVLYRHGHNRGKRSRTGAPPLRALGG